MTNSKSKVLLYADNSHQAFSAAVYAASLLQSNPNMQLTILQLKEIDESSKGVKFSWIELRKKYKSYYRECSLGIEYNWIKIGPLDPDVRWLQNVLNGPAQQIKSKYKELATKINRGFSVNRNVRLEKLCVNSSYNESAGRSEIVKAISNYARENSFELIIIGSRGFNKFSRMVLGSFAYDMLHKSIVPVVLIKKLPQEFIDSYLEDKHPLPELHILA